MDSYECSCYLAPIALLKLSMSVDSFSVPDRRARKRVLMPELGAIEWHGFPPTCFSFIYTVHVIGLLIQSQEVIVQHLDVFFQHLDVSISFT